MEHPESLPEQPMPEAMETAAIGSSARSCLVILVILVVILLLVCVSSVARTVFG